MRNGDLKVDLSRYESSFGTANKLSRLAWGAVWAVGFPCSPTPCFAWRNLLLRLFGATIGRGAHVYPSCRVWAPWNLVMGEYSCLAPRVDCYNVARVTLGGHAVVSQYSYLCTATHDVNDSAMRLCSAPIVVGDQAWVCADVFVGPGVTIGQGAVVGARSSVFGDLPAWKVCTGTPARPVRDREVRRP